MPDYLNKCWEECTSTGKVIMLLPENDNDGDEIGENIESAEPLKGNNMKQ